VRAPEVVKRSCLIAKRDRPRTVGNVHLQWRKAVVARMPAVCSVQYRDGCALLTWEPDALAYAEKLRRGCPSATCGLRGGQHIAFTDGDAGLLVRPEVARRQMATRDPDAPACSGAHCYPNTATRAGTDAAHPPLRNLPRRQTQTVFSATVHARSGACRA